MISANYSADIKKETQKSIILQLAPRRMFLCVRIVNTCYTIATSSLPKIAENVIFSVFYCRKCDFLAKNCSENVIFCLFLMPKM